MSIQRDGQKNQSTGEVIDMESQIKILPLTPGRWLDFETLFGKSGCMG
jgi:hypothetical protein